MNQPDDGRSLWRAMREKEMSAAPTKPSFPMEQCVGDGSAMPCQNRQEHEEQLCVYAEVKLSPRIDVDGRWLTCIVVL